MSNENKWLVSIEDQQNGRKIAFGADDSGAALKQAFQQCTQVLDLWKYTTDIGLVPVPTTTVSKEHSND